MWTFFKDNKGVIFHFNDKKLFYSIDKTPGEISLSTKVSRAVNILKDHFTSNGIPREEVKKYVDGEYNIGSVYFKPALGSAFLKICEKPRGKTYLQVVEGVVVPFDFDPQAHVEMINKEFEG